MNLSLLKACLKCIPSFLLRTHPCALGLLFVLFLSKPVPCSGIPTIVNPSFEAEQGLVWPGAIRITGWNSFGLVGINPTQFWIPVQGNFLGANDPYPFANNGQIPHGTNVAFIQNLALDESDGPDDTDARIWQNVTGFEQGKTYILVYHVNANTGTPPSLSVLLNQAVIDGPVNIGNIEPLFSRTIPFPRRISREWIAPSTGAFDLAFVVQNRPVTGDPELPDPLPRRPRKQTGAILLDHLRIIELGPLKLESARRSFQVHNRVTLRFSEKISRETATNTANFFLTPGNPVIQATLSPDARTVEIVAAAPLSDDQGPHAATVRGILAEDGRGMFQSNSQVIVDTAPILPVEIGRLVNGFQDNFDAAQRNPDWKVRGPDIFLQDYGILRVGSSQGSPSHLLYAASGYDPLNQEVLAKIRFLSSAGTDLGGVATSVSLDGSSGLSWMLQQEKTGSRSALFLDPASAPQPPVSINWVAETWYWIRLKHQPGNSLGDGLGRIWLADGDTSEPEAWHIYKYPVGQSPLGGFAGLTALQEDPGARLEVDYFLLLSPQLPEMVAELTKRPVALRIERTESKVIVWWPLDAASWSLEFVDLLNPDAIWNTVSSEFIMQDADRFFYETATDLPQFYYRLRE